MTKNIVTVAIVALCVVGVKESAFARSFPQQYAALVPQLGATKVPIFLPNNTIGGPNPLYAKVVYADRNSYGVTISPTDCYADRCEYATLYGMAETARDASERFPLTGTPVTLPNIAPGVVGYFNMFTCAVACGESTVSWNYNGFRYAVGVKSGNVADVLALATQLARFK